MSSKESDNKSERRVGDYVLLRRLGRGGMGKVYLARDVLLDRLVALKVLNGSFASDPSLVKRFRREAKAAAQLNHPNIVRVYAVREEKKVPYIAMEYVEGQTLEQMLAASGPMPWQRALDIVRQVAEALACAHSNGIVHRDIKPGNVLIDTNGLVRVTDFGLAKFVNATSGITSDGAFLGTPQYMSPEHCGAGEISPASDVFSLGVMLYEMLCGQRPFKGDTPMMLVKQISMDPVSPLELAVPNLPQSVYDLVNNLLEKDPKHRLASGPDLLGAIKNILSLKHVDFPASSRSQQESGEHTIDRSVAWCKRNWKSFALAALILTALALLILRALDARQHQSALPPDTDAAGFLELDASQVSTRLPNLSAALEPVDWLGDSLLAFGTEPRQGDKPGRIVLGAVRPENRAIETLAAFLPAPGWKLARRASPEFTVPRVPDSSPLAGGILAVLPARDPESGSYFQEVVLAKKKPNDMERSVVLRADPRGAFAGNAAYYSGGCFGAVARPDGDAVGLILSIGTTHREMYFAELRVGAGADGNLSRPVVDRSAPILSAAYASDGRSLAYVRVGAPAIERIRLGMGKRFREGAERTERQAALPPLRELVLRPDGPPIPTDLCLLRLGGLDGPHGLVTGASPDLAFAFSPDGRSLLASVPRPENAAPELLLFQVDTPGEPLRFGTGWISRSPWHASGRYFLTSSRDVSGKTKIEAIFPTGDTRRILVQETPLPKGAGTPDEDFPTPCVSSDGRWAAILSAEDNAPSLLFINLDKAVVL
ncbi:MAG: protein kinase [Candidatus Hydrogenedentes bacterium]|nr:protein kinase [Candidatus Hydrogenedentota bacterium]